jgi:integrase
MSVFKRPGKDTYDYDFQYRGHRFCGSTREANKRDALAFEKARKDKAKKEVTATLAAEAAIAVPRTWEIAATRYWHEVGQHHKNADTTFACLAWLTAAIGPKTALEAIDSNKVALLVAKRRNEVRRVGKVENRNKKVGAATVNRTMIEPLRKVLRRAGELWGSPVAKIRWSEHMLDEPQERVREASLGEEANIMAEISRGYEAAMLFAFRTGCRRMEIIGLKWTSVDFFTRHFTVLGKGNRSRTIPMADDVHDLLWGLRGNGSDHVFVYAAARTDKRKGLIKGKAYPITDAGLRTAQRRAIMKAGVENFRPHDARHTAATRTLRTSNMKVVQRVLGHSSMETTGKYAHVMSEDIRAALNAASPVKITVHGSQEGAKMLKEKDNKI